MIIDGIIKDEKVAGLSDFSIMDILKGKGKHLECGSYRDLKLF